MNGLPPIHELQLSGSCPLIGSQGHTIKLQHTGYIRNMIIVGTVPIRIKVHAHDGVFVCDQFQTVVWRIVLSVCKGSRLAW